MNGEALLDALADALADKLVARVAEKLAALQAPPAAQMATARHNPLGSSRAFLDAARAGRFESWRRGREVVARWSDVEAYNLARLRPRQRGSNAIEAALRKAGALQ